MWHGHNTRVDLATEWLDIRDVADGTWRWTGLGDLTAPR
jgi:hypothetical protein